MLDGKTDLLVFDQGKVPARNATSSIAADSTGEWAGIPLSSAFSRRGFLASVALTSTVLLLGLPGGVSPMGVRQAYADTDSALDDCVIRLRPYNFLRTLGVHNDGSLIGDVCWLWHQSTSSKHLLSWQNSVSAYTIRTLSNFEENEYASNSIWSVDDDSTKAGKAIHVWGSSFDNKKSRAFTFERQSDGSYYIKNVNSGLYLTLETPSSDKDENKLVQGTSPMAWDIEIVGKGLDGSSYPASTFWADYSTVATGANWMSRVNDNKHLDELSIPGTHDAGTCSVSNDTSPNTSMVKCQQDYIPTMLNEGIRYFDIRLGKGSDPGVNHGGFYVKKKDGSSLHFSDVVGYFDDFLTAQPTETLIMLVSNSDGENADITSALALQMGEHPSLFYGSNFVPTLGEVRGKIVLLRRFEPEGDYASAYKYGLNLTNWDKKISENETKGLYEIFAAFGSESSDPVLPAITEAEPSGLVAAGSDTQAYYTTVYAQDHYSDAPDDKTEWVDASLRGASTIGSRRAAEVDGASVTERRWVIDYTSCERWYTVHSNPYYAAKTVNEYLHSHSYINYSGFSSEEDCNKFVGIVVSDFTYAEMARSVYRRNYEDATVHSICYLPDSVTLTYGDDLADAEFVGGKTLGDGYFKLVDEDAVLDVASSGSTFALMYVHVEEDGTETETELVDDVPFAINSREVTIDWGRLDGLVAIADAQEALREALVNVIEGDDCTPVLEFYYDENGSVGDLVDDPTKLAAGAYWVRATGLEGGHAANYVLVDTEAVSFTVGAGSEASDATSDGEEGTTLAKTGDGAGIVPAAGIAAAAGAVAIATCTVLRHEEDVS